MAHIGGKKDKEPIAGTLLRLVCIHRVFIYYRLPSHSFFAVDTSNNTLKRKTIFMHCLKNFSFLTIY
jgi:hypothetical protein